MKFEGLLLVKSFRESGNCTYFNTYVVGWHYIRLENNRPTQPPFLLPVVVQELLLDYFQI